ncbi:MAG: hypothetical protein HY673_05795 [Chloroflexi bacterium]|nr:hypothetical protein [Chloroflexota bacterium]
MTKILRGTLYDKRIELEGEPELPSGTMVTVKIEPEALSLEERRRLVRSTAGAWGSDPTIGKIFDRIIRERRKSRGREVAF